MIGSAGNEALRFSNGVGASARSVLSWPPVKRAIERRCCLSLTSPTAAAGVTTRTTREKRRHPAQDLPARIVNAAIAIAEERGRWSAVRLHDSRAGLSPMDENADVAEQINELLGAVAALKAYVAHLPGAADVDLEAVRRAGRDAGLQTASRKLTTTTVATTRPRAQC